MRTWDVNKNRKWQQVKETQSWINILSGSVRSGKTVLANLRWLGELAKAVDHDGDMLMVGKTERTLQRNVLNPMRYETGGIFDYTPGTGIAKFGGREIHLVGANDERAEGKIRGATYYKAYVDEASLVPESFWQMLISRLSLSGSQMFATTNPDSPYHYLKLQYIDRAADLDLTHITFRLEDNLALDPAYVDNLKHTYTGLWYKRFVLGLWVQAAGAIYDMWDPDRHVKTLTFDPDGFFAACDYGTSNPCTFGLYAYAFIDKQPYVHLLKEYYYDGRESGQKTDGEYADDFGAFLGAQHRNVTVYIDPSAASFTTELRKRGFVAQAGENDVIDGIRVIGTMLAQARYTVDPSCTHTARQYSSYIWDEKAQTRGEDKPLKEHDHCPDRDRYGIYTRFGGERTLTGARLWTI